MTPFLFAGLARPSLARPSLAPKGQAVTSHAGLSTPNSV